MNTHPHIRQVIPEEETLLRPRLLSQYHGQDHVTNNLKIYVEAARQRNEALDHTLFFGPPGLGKTTLAMIIANEMKSRITITAGPILKKAGDLANLLVEAMDGDVIFIDEIHRLPPTVEEVLYSAMEDRRLDVILGSGSNATTINMELNHFTLVGATTMAGNISKPLRDRFGIKLHLDFYSQGHLENIVMRTGRVLGLVVDEGAATEIARRSRGTPRVANGLLRRVRDFAQVNTNGFVNDVIAKVAFESMGVDSLGLEPMDRKLLEIIIFQFGGGPVGLNTLATAIHEEQDVVSQVYEPYLVRLGLLDRSQQGRKATKAAVDHLNNYHAEQAQKREPR